ncbi:MAG: hypothetical protein HDT21_03120 [Ruminococcus sp.]|nr:hypothetical protein [Ruminococcus sp.]
MSNKKICLDDNKILTYTLTSTSDSLKLLSSDAKYSRAILNEVLVDATANANIQLGEYYQNTLRYLIEAMPVRNRVLIDCANWLKETHFKNFSVLKIFIRYKKKEIVVVSDSMSDIILDEFYNKTFEFAYEKDNEIVFIITDEKAIDYSAMPKYDRFIEVVKHE